MISFALISCSPISHKNVDNYIKNIANDPSSYQPVEYGKLDTVYSSFFTSEKFIKNFNELKELYDNHTSEIDEFQEDVDSYSNHVNYPDLYDNIDLKIDKDKIQKDTDLMISTLKTAKEIINDINLDQNNFKKSLIGYKMSHTYRLKNMLGNNVLNNDIFIMDKDFNVKGIYETESDISLTKEVEFDNIVKYFEILKK